MRRHRLVTGEHLTVLRSAHPEIFVGGLVFVEVLFDVHAPAAAGQATFQAIVDELLIEGLGVVVLVIETDAG